jgi:LmbE family N-acetylglucosaminyl deacetylase
MVPLVLPPTEDPLRILVLGAHADDIEIGAGGTLLRWTATRSVDVRAVVFSATDERRAEAEHSASVLLADSASWVLDVHGFVENLFPDQVAALKRSLDDLRHFSPHVVLTHRLHERHQDHRTIGELTWQSFRDHLILQYEIPKWEGDLATPTTYVPLDDATLDRKIDIIRSAFVSQHDKQWFDDETFRAIARLRGLECGHRWAEGFHSHKAVLEP